MADNKSVRLTHTNGAAVTVDAEKAERLIAGGNFSASGRSAAAAPAAKSPAKKAAKRTAKRTAKKAAPARQVPVAGDTANSPAE